MMTSAHAGFLRQLDTCNESQEFSYLPQGRGCCVNLKSVQAGIFCTDESQTPMLHAYGLSLPKDMSLCRTCRVWTPEMQVVA
jgi:hypothetical protein